MKNSKIVAAMAAASMAVSMLSMVTASADITSDIDEVKVDGKNVFFSLTDNGYDPAEVKSVSFTFSVDDTDGFGGGIMFQSDKNSWDQRDGEWDWGNPGADKPITAEGEDGEYTLTFDLEGYFDDFDGDITWAQVYVQQWWGNNITVTAVDVVPTDAETTDGETDTTGDQDTTDAETTGVGDVNGDGKINVTDISKVAAHVKNVKALTTDEQDRADVNGDGKINVTDVSLLAAHVKNVKKLAVNAN